MIITELSQMLDAYVACALWSSIDFGVDGTGDLPMDENYDRDDIAPSALAEMRADVEAFYLANAADLTNLSSEQAGCDFWLTRNRHGAGFWDRGLGAIGDRLSAAAHVYGESALYVGDDGKLYV